MEKLHEQFVDGCLRQPGMTEEMAEELFRQVAAFASFGFAKSHAAAFARTAYESSFLKLFYPAQFLVGLINAQPMGFYPVEVLVNDAKRHGVAVLPVDLNASSYKTTTEWVGRPGEPLPDGRRASPARPEPVRSPALRRSPSARGARALDARGRRAGWGVRLGLHLVKGIGEQHEELLDRELARGPYASLADVVERTGCRRRSWSGSSGPGRSTRSGRPRRELLWQLREVAGAARGRVDGRPCAARRAAAARGRRAADGPAAAGHRGPGRCRRSPSRSGSATPTRSSGWTRGARWSRCSGRRSIGSARCPTRVARRSGGPGRCGSAAWS